MSLQLDFICKDSFAATKKELFARLDSLSGVFPPNIDAKVLLKPNLNANMNALTGNTTDLRLLAALLEYLKERGYSRITIAEGTNSGFYRNKIGVISRLMIDNLGAWYGAKVKDLNYAQGAAVEFANGITALAARDCLEAELFINLPKLKTHFEAGMSVCLKNLMGCLIGQENKKKTHQSLAANIVNLNQVLRPHLHIVDALVAMEGLGPTRGVPVNMGALLLGRDPYLIDLACARLASFDPRQVTTLAEAERRGLVTAEHKAYVAGFDFEGRERKFAPPKAGPLANFIHSPKRQKYFLAVRNTKFFTYLSSTKWFGHLLFLSGLRQDVFDEREMDFQGLELEAGACDDCGFCGEFCPLGLEPQRELRSGELKCLNCLYCFMVCPRQAIKFRGEYGFLAVQLAQYDAIVRGFYAKGQCRGGKNI